VGAATSLVEDFLGPPAKGFGRQGEQPMKGLKKPRKLSAHIGHKRAMK